MEWIEVTGRTVDEAKERALDELGVHESELEYELLDEARSGFLGRIGRSDARIRARIKPLSREKPADKRRRRRSEGRSEGGEGSSGNRGKRSRPARAGGSSASKSSGGGSGGAGAARKKPGRASTDASGDNAGPATPPKPRNRSRQRQSRPTEDALPSSDEEQTDMDTEVNLDEQEAVAVEFLQGLLDALGAHGTVRGGRTDDDGITVDIEGDELGLLVGPKGATLAALEELTRAAVQHAAEGQRARLHVDVGGYRQRRREALAEFTKKVAAEVRAAGEARALEPMSASDRKVVHDTVAELDGLATASEGEDTRRHVVIRPA